MEEAQSRANRARVDAAHPLLLDEEIRHLDSVGELRPRPPGHTFFLQGEKSDDVLLIKQGHVKVVAGNPPTIAAFRKPGETVGEMAYLRGTPRSASIIAYDEVLALLIPGQAWLEFLYDHPRAMHAQLVAADERLEQATTKFVGSGWAVERKLAQVLVELLDLDLGEQVGDKHVLSLNQRDLASLTAASHDAIKKIIRKFKDLGIVDTGRETVEIRSRDALVEIIADDQVEGTR